MVSYDYIWDEALRLNKSYLEADPNAAGVAPRATIDSAIDGSSSSSSSTEQPPSSASDKKPQAQKGGKTGSSRPPSASSKVNSRPPSATNKLNSRPPSAATSKPSTAAKKGKTRDSLTEETLLSLPTPDEPDFNSPNLASVGDVAKINELAPEALAKLRSNAGKFAIKTPLQEMVKKFCEEPPAVTEEEGGIDAVLKVDDLGADAATNPAIVPALGAQPPATAAAAASAASGVPNSNSSSANDPARHPEYVFLLADVKVKPLSPEQVDELNKEELEEYKEELTRAFLPLNEAQLVSLKVRTIQPEFHLGALRSYQIHHT